ncbi:MAG: hypothetical protein IT196_10555 [Acidimicrobiales bacterium]|nr:hypothetical protein [Acidimicrobiales bacterium]
MPIAKTLTDMQTAAFDQLIAAQSKIVEINKELAGRLGDVTDKLPAVPMMDEAIEANRSLVDNVFGWSSKLIEANRTFTNDLLSVWLAPSSAPSPVATPKAAAAK